MKQAAKAKQWGNFAIFTFSQSSGLDEQLLLVHQVELKVQSAMDLMMGVQKWAATDVLARRGNDLHTVGSSSSLRKLRHILDDLSGRRERERIACPVLIDRP